MKNFLLKYRALKTIIYLVIVLVIVALFVVLTLFLSKINKNKEITDFNSTSLEKLIDTKGKNGLLSDSLEIPSFAGIKEDIFRDKDSVYYRGEKIFNANPDKFQEIGWGVNENLSDSNFNFNPNKSNVCSGLFKDDKNVYFLYKEKFYIAKDIYPGDIQILTGGNREAVYSFLKSGGNIYDYYEHGYCQKGGVFGTKDLTKFTINDNEKTVEFSKLNISDPQSFELVGGSQLYLFVKDQKNIYYYATVGCDRWYKIFEDSDPRSFICDIACKDCLFACRDSQGVYSMGGVTFSASKNGIDPQTFQRINESKIYFKDKNNVYFVSGSEIEKLDLNVKMTHLAEYNIFDNRHIYRLWDNNQKPSLVFNSDSDIDYKFFPYYITAGKNVYFFDDDYESVKKIEKAKTEGFSVFLCSKYDDRSDSFCGKDQNGKYYIEGKMVKAEDCSGCDIKENYKFENQ